MTLPDPNTYWLFLGAALVILLIPGPAVLYIVARSVDQGRVAGVVSALGVGVGNLVHVVAAVVGLSALLAASAAAFGIVKYAGAAYLVVLGIRRLRHKNGEPSVEIERKSLRRIFRQGIVVNVLNPKIALFFLAFLPQFVDPSRGGVASQTFVLGVSLVLLGMVTDSTYGMVMGSLGGWLRRSRRAAHFERYVSGGTYIALGLGSAATGSPSE